MTKADQTFAILLGGDLTVTDRLLRQIDGARVIAADAGIAHARSLNVTPELWIGDFDSASREDRTLFSALPRAEFPADKAKTDGELAVDAALARGATHLVLVGAFGGPRIDHALLHLAMGWRLAAQGNPVILSSGDQEGLPLITELRPDWPAGTQFSICGLDDLTGLTIEGARWPLDAVQVPFGTSLTLSNRVSDSLRMSLESGRALAIASFEVQP